MPEIRSPKKKTGTRRLLHTAAIYLSSSLTALGVTDLLSRHYGFSFKLFDSVLAVLACGFPAVLIFVARHAKPGRQKFAKKELAAYAGLGLVAVLAVVKIAGLPGPLRISPDAKSIAVLPFQNLSDSKEDEYFSDGVTEDIITQLARIADLKVISRTSVMAYKNTSKSLRQIGQALGAGVILEGSVRRENDRVRIVSQLIDAKNDRHLWAETYNRPMTDILAIQSEVAQRIAQELRARLTESDKERLRKKATVNADAYAFTVRGRDYYYKYTREDNDQAIALFKKATEIDPEYAPAWAGLGDAYAQRWNYGYPQETLDTAVEMSRKALALAPDLAEGYKALGLAQESKGLVKEGLDSYYQAVALNPNYAPVVANIGSINFKMGKYDEALKWIRKSVELQPGFARFYALVGLQYLYLDLDEPARSWLERSLEFQPGYIFPEMVLASFAVYEGKIDEARERIAKILAAHPEEPNALNVAGDVELVAGRYRQALPYYEKLAELTSPMGAPGNKLAFVLIKTGDRSRADRLLAENLTECLKDPALNEPWSPLRYYIAEAYAVQGKSKEAMDWLEKAVDGGFGDRWLFIDPLFENVRSDPRFTAIRNKLDKRLAKMRDNVKKLGLDR